MKKSMTQLNHKSSFKKDLAYITVFTLIIWVILLYVDAFELLVSYSRAHEEFEVDEIILVLLVGSFSGIWYSIRRFNEIKKIQIQMSKINKTLEKNIQKSVEDIRKKDEMLNEQSKMAAMGEMLENIAHQWRQPLSVISTGASGIKLQKEFDTLSDDDLELALTGILNNASYLSKTIDDFREFIKGDKEKTLFNLSENINKNIGILQGVLTMYNIKIVLDCDDDIVISSYPNELTQSFINFVNNAKDAFEENKLESKFIFISTKKENEKVIIKIKDNAGGIPENIITKIFEPYFTTKHKSRGTGLGLHITYNLIIDGMGGLIEVNNITYKYDDEEYNGAEFIITLI